MNTDPFIEYISSLKSKLPMQTQSVSVVLGNESCDLDSTIASLALSYFLNKINNNPEKIVLPVMNVVENEFPLRTENVYVLNKYGIKEDLLIYRDTIDLNEVKQTKNLDVTLVDHHVLSKHYEYLKENVKQIFDHRPLDVKSNWKGDVSVDMKIVGSCCTLIANEIFKKDSSVLTPIVGKLLYETIIFDTIGLKEEAGKVKELDLEMCQKLESYLNIKPNPIELFNELWSAHIDVSKLTSKQLLAKDLKTIRNILIPGLPMLVKQYLKQCDVLKHIRDFCLEKGCDHIILMGLEAKDGQVERDIAFYTLCEESQLIKDVIQKLMDYQELEIKEECCDIENVRYFRHNFKLSRKQIVPQVQEVLEKM